MGYVFIWWWMHVIYDIWHNVKWHVVLGPTSRVGLSFLSLFLLYLCVTLETGCDNYVPFHKPSIAIFTSSCCFIFLFLFSLFYFYQIFYQQLFFFFLFLSFHCWITCSLIPYHTLLYVVFSFFPLNNFSYHCCFFSL